LELQPPLLPLQPLLPPLPLLEPFLILLLPSWQKTMHQCLSPSRPGTALARA